MHSSVLFLLASGAALAAATQSPDPTFTGPECAGKGSFYKCFNNGFHGYCSVDPCARDWCPDYVDKTCTKKTSSSSSSSSTISSASIPNYSTVATSTTAGTSTTVASSTGSSTSTGSGSGSSTTAYHSTSTHAHWTSTSITSSRSYSNSTSTRYYGNSTTTRHHHHTSSTTDDCSETSYSKPTSTKHWTVVTQSSEAPTTATYTTGGGPSVTPSRSHPHHYSSIAPSPSPSPCPGCDNKCPPPVLPGCLQPAGNYNYYMCVSNGFKGHCTSDPCGKAWCPDFKQGTCEPPRPADQHPQCTISTVTLTVTASPSSTVYSATATATATASGTAKPYDETGCAPGTGYFQSCGNGFRGCCKSDACTLGYCPSN